MVSAYLESRHRSTLEQLKAAAGRHRDPREASVGVFEAQGELFAEPGLRGCAIVTATAEAADGGIIDEAAEDYQGRCWPCSPTSPVRPPSRIRQDSPGNFTLVYDGAGVAARMDRDPSIARAARAHEPQPRLCSTRRSDRTSACACRA